MFAAKNQADRETALLLHCLGWDAERTRVAVRSVELDEAGWRHFLEVAVRQKVSALLFYRLKERDCLSLVPEFVQVALRERYFGNAARNMRNFHYLKDVLRGF